MIPLQVLSGAQVDGKPRASGDDPILEVQVSVDRVVNPARAGMIRSGIAQVR